MIILGIADNHESHACILINGVLVAAVAEERLSRLKTDSSYPHRAIEKVIFIAGIKEKDIDLVVFAGANDLPYLKVLREAAIFSVSDWVELQERYWKPKLYKNKPYNEIDRFNMFKHKIKDYINTDYYKGFFLNDIRSSRHDRVLKFQNYRKEVVSNHLGISHKKVKFLRHEDCHKAYGYYSSPNRKRNALIFTCEGGGDDSSATVSIINDHKIRELWKSNKVMVGGLYAHTTLALAMKPNQHEYKVMGLAAYGNSSHGMQALKYFRTIEKVSGTKIVQNSEFNDLYFHTLENLKSERFDNIAWALQEFLEETLESWVVNNIKKYGIKDIIFSGGVGQNIKLMRRLMLNKNIGSVWVGPISGDGSLAIGAAWLAHAKYSTPENIQGFSSIYLGTSYSRKEIDSSLKNYKFKQKVKFIENPTAKYIASLMNDGLIIGRFSDRMEFGQRSLGNRSIMADPRTLESVYRINKVIKQRDFWMPFTPSVLEEYSKEIFYNPKKVYSPYMTMAFDSSQESRKKLPAVIHPADGTIRPQMLREGINKGYSNIIKEFYKISGFPVILNTSFNLHGEPIVESPDDAISTFIRSDLDVLLFDHIAIIKNI